MINLDILNYIATFLISAPRFNEKVLKFARPRFFHQQILPTPEMVPSEHIQTSEDYVPSLIKNFLVS